MSWCLTMMGNKTLDRMTTALGIIGEAGRCWRGSHAVSLSLGPDAAAVALRQSPLQKTSTF